MPILPAIPDYHSALLSSNGVEAIYKHTSDWKKQIRIHREKLWREHGISTRIQVFRSPEHLAKYSERFVN